MRRDAWLDVQGTPAKEFREFRVYEQGVPRLRGKNADASGEKVYVSTFRELGVVMARSGSEAIELAKEKFGGCPMVQPQAWTDEELGKVAPEVI